VAGFLEAGATTWDQACPADLSSLFSARGSLLYVASTRRSNSVPLPEMPLILMETTWTF
jgi:hypothetical protein